MKRSSTSIILPLVGLAAMLAGCGSGEQESGAAGGAANAELAALIGQRQDNFEALSDANKALKAELEKEAPSIEALRTEQEKLGAATARISTFFPEGSGPEAGVETEALPAIWANRAEFDAALAKLTTGSAALQAAVQAGDMAAVRTAMTEVSGSCKACHDRFREKKS